MKKIINERFRGFFSAMFFLVLALSFSRCVVMKKICKGICYETTEELKHIFLIRTCKCRSCKKDPETGKNTI